MSHRQFLMRRLRAAHNVLDNPKSTDPQRSGARCRINHTVTNLRKLPPVPAMKRGLAIDKGRQPIVAPKRRRTKKVEVSNG